MYIYILYSYFSNFQQFNTDCLHILVFGKKKKKINNMIL